MIEKQAVLFDYGRTLYDPTRNDLFPHVPEVLEFIQGKSIGIGLVTVALGENLNERYDDLNRFGLTRYFDEIEVISRRRAQKDFTEILAKLGVAPSDSMVVGDNLKREIEAGNRIGAFTVWTRERLLGRPEPRTSLQVPGTTIDKIKELIPHVEQRLL